MGLINPPGGAITTASLQSLVGADPDADRILFWDDSAGAFTYLTVSTGLSVSGTNLTATSSGDVVGPSSSIDNGVVRFDSTTGKLIQDSPVTIDDSAVIAAKPPGSGAGNSLTLRGSDAVSGNTNGGDVILQGGALFGSGATGIVHAYGITIIGDIASNGGLVVNNASGAAQIGNTGQAAILQFNSGTVYVICSSTYVGAFSTYGLGIITSGAIYWNAGGLPDIALYRHAAGVLRLSDNLVGFETNAIAAFLCSVLVEANTAGSGSPNVLIAAESRKLLTNEGATAENYHLLPTAVAGLDFEFVCQDTDGIRVTANTGDTIRIVGSVSASAGYIKSTVVGSAIRLKALNATEWLAVSVQGTWTIDS